MVEFDPARGSEQAGTRPAVVVSNDINNRNSTVVIVAAITKTVPEKHYPQNVFLPGGVLPEDGTIMGGQLLTVAKERLLRYRGELSGEQTEELNEALRISLGLPRGVRPAD